MDAADNSYSLLGVPVEATEAKIKKAYRKLALAKHPDKNRDNPNAADEFAALQRAYDLLLDPEARKALNNLLSAKAVRAERTAFQDEKRRRMAEDLEKRERNWDRARNQEESARARLQQEIERLRRQAVEREAKAQADRRAAAAVAGEVAGSDGVMTAAAVGGLGEEDMLERLGRTLKVSWSRKEGEYSTPQLRQLFARHGEVQDVVIREGKKKKGSALVVMSTAAGAAAAAQAVNGEVSRPLLVVPFSSAAAAADLQPAPQQGAQPASFQAALAGGPSVQPPAFAAAANSANPLGGKPTVPLFAAGAPTRPGLFSGAAAAATATNGSAAAMPSSSGRPLFAAGTAAASGGAAMPSSFPTFTSASVGSNGALGEMEGSILAKMRQAEERRRLIAQMEQDEFDR